MLCVKNGRETDADFETAFATASILISAINCLGLNLESKDPDLSISSSMVGRGLFLVPIIKR